MDVLIYAERFVSLNTNESLADGWIREADKHGVKFNF